MKKCKPIALACILPLLLTSCGVDEGIILWHPFGAGYTEILNDVVAAVKDDLGILVTPKSQGSYDKLQDKITKSVATSSYPDIALGYPDHFAGYIKDEIMLELTPYINMYNEKHSTDLVADFYPQYMQENLDLRAGKIYGIPFNKSTEVMVYNVDLFKYLQAKDPTIVKVPETWDEFAVEGLKYIKVLHDEEIFRVEDDQGNLIRVGKGIAVKYNENGPAEYKYYLREKTIFNLDPGFVLIADFTDTKEIDFNVLMWDSHDNLFITAMRQWGSSYTGFTAQEEASRSKKGHLEFWSSNPDYAEYKPATMQALRDLYHLYVNDQYESHIFSVSGDLYNSDAFKKGAVLFNVGSSGGLSNNVPKGQANSQKMSTPLFEVGIEAIPYKTADKKFVISQGTNFGLFDHQKTDEEVLQELEIVAQLTTGEYQGYWAATTGYFPASVSATNSETYQEFLNGEKSSDKALYQKASILNESKYMSDEAGWTKFVDKAFVGSSPIRAGVKPIIRALLNKKAEIEAAADKDAALDAAIRTVLDNAVKDLSDYNK